MSSVRTRTLVVGGLLVAGLALALGSARTVRADEGRRSTLKNEIEQLLSNMASELRDVPGDSGTSDLDHTIDYAGQVADKARELKDHADSDSDAQRMASYYPDYARHYQDAARYLREEKNDFRKLDEYPRKCEDAMRELASRLRAFTDSGDPRGIDEVPKLAREFAKIGKEAVEQAEGVKRMTAERYDRVDDFSDSDGKWSDVRNNLIAAGSTMKDHTVQLYDQIKRDDVCGNLAKEERDPLVEQAMQKLFEGKKGIELLYASLDAQLQQMASSLDGLVGDSSDSDIGAAEQRLTDIEGLLDQLDRVKGNDGEARRRVETWRNIARAGREAMKQLRTLKQSQFIADRAPEKCGEAKTRVQELIRSYQDEREDTSVAELQLRARGIAAPIKEGLTKTDEQHAVMERALAETVRFDPSEGRWREVTEKNRGSANAIFDYWKKARENAHAACDDLAKGDQSQVILDAAKDLGADRSTAETRMLLLQGDVQKWEDGIRELRDWYKQDTANVRQLFCTLPESPGDSAEGDAYAAQLAQIADRMRDRLKPKWSQIEGEAIRLQAEADALIRSKEKTVKSAAIRVRGKVADKMKSLTNLLNNELNGANDPDVRAQMETGKNEHKRIQADSSKCGVDEIAIPRESMRMDCVRVSSGTCYIVEIKPNNSDAQARGKAQLTGYKRAMQDYFDQNKDKVESAFSGKLEIFKQCIGDGRMTIDTELRVYEYCPADGALFHDFVVE